MNTIANLYHTARQHPIDSNINAYSEAVNALLESKPLDYISNLEYIISSDIGLQTLPSFIEKYGIAIPLYDTFIEKFDTCIEKCKTRNVDSKQYEDWKKKFESFKQDHSNCFSMFNYYTDKIDSINSYIETYYSFNNKGIQNSKNVTGMLKKFGEAAIPDILFISEKYNQFSNIVDTLIKEDGSPLYYEWMSMVIPDFINDNTILKGIYESVVSRSASMIVFNAYARNDHIFKESLLSDSEYQAEFTDSDIDAMRDLISINEQLLQECTDEAKSFSLYKGINKLYEHVAAYEEKFIKDSDDVFEESTWESNTMDKKTGKVPGYLANNHDYATWGEDDTSTKKKKDNDDDKSLEDYERPSAKENKKDDPLDKIDTSSLDKPTPVADKLANETDKEMKQAINNYYYYTYNNSLNKTRDDHSIHKDSHDVRTTDDHSVGKMINSSKVSGKDSKDEEKEESGKPWELDDIFGSIENFNEGSTQNADRPLDDDDPPPEIGSADADKPKSDHPVQDALHDIDRKMTSTQQNVKKTVQSIENTGRVFMKPFRRVKAWIDNMIANFKDKDENSIKEKIADPHARKNIFSAARAAVEVGALAKAGILLNPLFLAIAGFKAIGNKKKAQRIRNEMVGELKTEIEIVNEKIKDADRAGDTRAKYQLMRFRNELNKKLLRVGGYAKQAPLSNVI